MVNQTNELYGRNFGIDKLTYMVLRQVLKRAGEFINIVEQNNGDDTSHMIYGSHKEKTDNFDLERQIAEKTIIRPLSKNPQDSNFSFGKNNQKGSTVSKDLFTYIQTSNQASTKSKGNGSPSGECCPECLVVKAIERRLGCAEQHTLCQDCVKRHVFLKGEPCPFGSSEMTGV